MPILIEIRNSIERCIFWSSQEASEKCQQPVIIYILIYLSISWKPFSIIQLKCAECP